MLSFVVVVVVVKEFNFGFINFDNQVFSIFCFYNSITFRFGVAAEEFRIKKLDEMSII